HPGATRGKRIIGGGAGGLKEKTPGVNLERRPPRLQKQLGPLLNPEAAHSTCLPLNGVHCGDSPELLQRVAPDSIRLSVWSPPYFVGKGYEAGFSFEDWRSLLQTVIKLHYPAIEPGGFLVINIADILCFKDASMPKAQAEAVSRRRSPVTLEDVLQAK